VSGKNSVLNPDPFGSALFRQIHIHIRTGIQGLLIRMRSWNGFISVSTKCEAKLYFFSRQFLTYLYTCRMNLCTVQNIERYGTLSEKDKTMETATAMKSRKISNFPTCVKFGVGSGSESASGSASKWKVRSRSASKRCRSKTFGKN
jgi:hypothetical protein